MEGGELGRRWPVGNGLEQVRLDVVDAAPLDFLGESSLPLVAGMEREAVEEPVEVRARADGGDAAAPRGYRR